MNGTSGSATTEMIDGKSLEELREPIGAEDRLRYGDVRFCTQLLKAAENERVISGNLDVQETLRIAERKVRGSDRAAENLIQFVRNDVSVAIDVLRDVWMLWQIFHNHSGTQVPVYLWQLEVNETGEWFRVVAPCKESALSIVYATFFADRLTDTEFRKTVGYQLIRYHDGVPIMKVVGGTEVLQPASQWLDEWKAAGKLPGPFQWHGESPDAYVEITDPQHVLRGGGIDEVAPQGMETWMAVIASVGKTIAEAREDIGNGYRFRCLRRYLPPAKNPS